MKRMNVIALCLTIASLVTSCSGGGGGGTSGNSSGGGAPAIGPGDTQLYFPNTLGDTWYLNVTGTDNNGNPTRDLGKLSVTGTKTVLGQLASIFQEQLYSDPSGSTPLENYYAKSLEGVTFLGDNDPLDTLTLQMIPYKELLFPVQVGQIELLSRSGLNFGMDLDGDGRNETISLTLQSNITGFESVNVAAGSFPSAVKRVLNLTGTLHLSASGVNVPITKVETTWAVPRVGFVKRTDTTTIQDPTGGSSSQTASLEARGYVIDGISHGMGWPFTVTSNLSNINYTSPIGHPAIASDGTNFLVMAKKASGPATSPNSLANWIGTLVGPDGAVIKTFDATVTAPVTDGMNTERAAIAFDGTNYLFVFENDHDLASTGPRPSLAGVWISRSGVPIGSEFALGPSGTNSPALAFDGTNYLLVYRKFIPISGLEQIRGVFISPGSGQITGGEFPITPAPGYQEDPAIAFDGTNYLVAWDQQGWDTQTPGIYVARVGRDSTVLDASGILISNQLGHPAVAFDGTNYMVAYQRSPNNLNYQIFATRISKGGQLLDGSPSTGGLPITTAPSISGVSVTLAFAGSEYWAAWVSTPAIGVYNGIFGARIGADGVVRSPGSSGMPISPKTSSFYPAIAMNPT